MQVQNQLNAFIVLAAFLWCVLAAVTMILQEHSTQAAVIQLWYAYKSLEPISDQTSVCMLQSSVLFCPWYGRLCCSTSACCSPLLFCPG